MFVSLPDYRFHVPTPLAAPGAAYWRCLVLSTTTPWYLLTTRADENSPADTFLMVWDSDVVQAIKTCDVQVESLTLVSRNRNRNRWDSIDIAEIWEASDPEYEEPQVLLVDVHGAEYSGYFMQPAVGVQRLRLVVKFPVRSSGPRATGEEH